MKKPEPGFKFLYGNPYSYQDEQILQMLLRFATDDSQELARKLLLQFGSIGDLMDASADDLFCIEGMNSECALLMRLVPELHRRYFLSRSKPEARMTQPSDFGRFLLPYFYGVRNEVVYLMTLDAACKVINCRMMGEGSVNSASVPVRRLVQEAISTNATAVVIAHNHPSGIALPSQEDIELTNRLKDALSIIEISLLDHLIIADDDFVSMRESGYLNVE